MENSCVISQQGLPELKLVKESLYLCRRKQNPHSYDKPILFKGISQRVNCQSFMVVLL